MILKEVGTDAFPLHINHYDGTQTRFECALGTVSEDDENIYGEIVEVTHHVYKFSEVAIANNQFDSGWRLMASHTTNVRNEGE
jgi:hypothetical protein